MSCNSSWRTDEDSPLSGRRRALLKGLLTAPLLGLGGQADADGGPLAGLRRWGMGEFRRFGMRIYAATLWAGDDPLQPPRALRLDYQRDIAGRTIAEASVREMRRFVDDENRLRDWGERLGALLPDVRTGDHLLGVQRGQVARFYQDSRLLGGIDAPGFAQAFFAIWLDPRTSAPDLRAALLGGDTR